MFKIVNDYFLEEYRSKTFIIRKKSRYLLTIVTLTFFSMFVMLLLDAFETKIFIGLASDMFFLLVCTLSLVYIKAGKLESTVNIYITGYVFTMFTREIIVNLLCAVKLSHYNVLILVITLVVGFTIISLVSTKPYQMYIILYFSILVTILDSVIIYIKTSSNYFNADMITHFIYYFLIILGGCILCIIQFRMNNDAIKILDSQNNQLLVFTYMDNLTGLYNRKKMLEVIEKLSFIKNEKFAVFFIDLDNFKNINDNWGHQSGDELLKAISKRLQSIINENDTLYRIGGDEFIIILKNFKLYTDIEQFAQNVNKTLSTAITHKEKELYIGASIGISIFPEHGSNEDTLMNNADLAMYEVKRNGGHGYKLYSTEMENKSIDKLNVKMKLDKALRNNEFIAYYQPILDLNLMKVMGAEALIRWNHKGKIILPMEFITIAKNIGSLDLIDNWMIKNACMQCKKWHDMGLKDFYISVNTSFKQLAATNFVKSVTNILHAYSLSPMYLRLEITEDEVMINPDLIINILTQLRTIGIKIYLDDFGKGYSSLSYVNTLPIDIIKIDMSLIKNLDKNPKNMVIVKSTINMAHILNIKVVSEGIESQEQLNILKELKSDYIQGYLIGKPLPSSDFESKFIIKNNNI